MGRKRKNPVAREKQELFGKLIETYDIQSAKDLETALKDLLSGAIETMLGQELEMQMEESRAVEEGYHNMRNGYKPKRLRSSLGEIPIEVPQDRNSDFEPVIVPKYEKDITEIEGKIIAMYARGMSTRQISDQIRDIYGFEVSEGMVSGITNKLLPEIEAWQKRPLSAVYPIVFIDAIIFNVRENNVIRKQAAYIILGVSEEGHKEVLSIAIGETESAKFWLSLLNEVKNRGVKDIFVLCADGLSGIQEAVAAAYPRTEVQRCIVHMVRNTLQYVADKDKKAFANDLKSVYHAPDEEHARSRLETVTQTWQAKYPGCMRRWAEHWDVVSPMFKFSLAVRKVIYTTNAIESLNSGYRRLNRNRSVFPSAASLLKALYLATAELTRKWTLPLRNWGQVYNELAIMYPDRMS